MKLKIRINRALLITFVITLSLALLSLAGCAIVNPQLTPFYTPPDPLPLGAPGEIIRTETLETGNPSVHAWRVMYHSRDLNNNDIAITGLFAIPTVPPPADGFPLLAVAHGTEGLARQCAPSIDPWSVPPPIADYVSNPDTLVVPFVQNGYAVTLTDYQGLGAPGNSSYLVGTIEAQNVFDSIRAIRAFDQIKLNPQTFVWGHSQGGHSVAFVAQLAQQIAPEIHLDGFVLSAPATQLKALVDTVLAPDAPSPLTGVAAMVAASWSQTYNFPLDTLFTADGIQQSSALYGECILGVVRAYSDKPPKTYYFTDPTTTAPWSDTLLLNIPHAIQYPAPIFVVQGTTDQVVSPQITQAFAQALCAAGNTVQFQFFPNSDHLQLIHTSLADVVAWLNARAKNEPAPTNCDTLPTTTNPTPPAANTPILTKPFDSVILTDGDFTPDPATIAALETQLPAFLAQNQSKFNPTLAPVLDRLPAYKLQYWGELDNSTRLITINALCTPLENWQTQRILVLDGGDCFFTLTYDPATKTFSNLSVNGEA